VTLVVTLKDAAGAGAVGGKAASLGELARAGVAVPPGFAITTEAFSAAMTAVDADGALRAGIEALPATDTAEIARVAARFRALVAGAPVPADVAAAITAGYLDLAGSGQGGAGEGGAGQVGVGQGDAGQGSAGQRGAGDGRGDRGAGPDVAVRSSATVEDSAEASFAGLQDTYLGLSGADSVLDHVRRCWASLYNDESVAYRRRLGLPEAGVAMAVVVQRMVAPRAAGVMFTRSPVTGDRSVVAIEGTWGLGSALVSGDVTPDSWVISKVTSEITGRRVSPKAKIHSYLPNGGVTSPAPPPELPGPEATTAGAGQPAGAGDLGRVVVRDTPAELRDAPCLTDDEIRALAVIARQVEAHYGAPQDIEWAVLDGEEEPGARIVLLQSRPETVWASRDAKPAGAPKPRAADHVLSLFGKPL
jgi:pyruvate,water dikinase